MNYVQKLYELTLELQALLNEEITDKNRAEIIEEINVLVETREEYIKKLLPPYTTEEKMLGRKLISVNADIQEKMQILYSELKLELKNVKKQKKSSRSYMNPYASMQNTGGMFMDSKK
ncbi:flagellar protein FliT [Virgibacillus sp. YIM 98842]|uniref:flagellar protein FliT n=1 Tax=Virgibacillus sp. YIM 98842 TaxID=2663533 RepID=UPI0013D931FF|nr:flagellar protein FliT [Virgibacillus sp. YIM 98842]